MLAAESPPKRSTPTQGRILLVDDEPLFRDSAVALLRSRGFECEPVEGPGSALAALEEQHFDVVVTDLMMEGEAQIRFLERVAGRAQAPSILVVTAYPTLESAITAVDLGIVGYLPKPFEADDFVERVARALQRRRFAALLTTAESSLRQASDALESMVRLSEPGSASSSGRSEAAPDAVTAEQLRRLTPREHEIVGEFLQGYRLSTIARRLEISAHTVRRHLKSIFLKLEVGSQAELLEKLKP